MTLKSLMNSDIENIFFNTNEFADSAIYNSKDGTISHKAIKVVIDNNIALSDANYGMNEIATITLKKTDVNLPKIYDTITVDTTIYTVRQRISGDGYVWVLAVETDQRGEPIK